MKIWKIIVVLVVPLLLPVTSVFAAPVVPDSFSTSWDTTVADDLSSSDQQVRVDLGTCPTAVYWEEVGNDSNNGTTTDSCTDGDILITFPSSGQYRIDFSGNFSSITLGNDSLKILTVEQWGNSAWQTMVSAFDGAQNVSVTAADAPNLSAVTDMSRMFADTSNFNESINHWDVSNITNMSELFMYATAFNQPLDSWNVSVVGDMGGMFAGATAFNQPLNSWDVSNVNNMLSMFEGATAFNQPLDSWNVSVVSDMGGMFEGATAFNQPLGDWQLGSICVYQRDHSRFFVWEWFIPQAYAADCISANLIDIFTNSGLDSNNYATTLISWAGDSVSAYPGRDLGTVSTTYCDTAEAARASLINVYGWIIHDLGPVNCDVSEDDESASGGGESTRVGERQKNTYLDKTLLPNPNEGSFKHFLSSVEDLITYLTINEEEIKQLNQEESSRLIVALRDILRYILILIPGI